MDDLLAIRLRLGFSSLSVIAARSHRNSFGRVSVVVQWNVGPKIYLPYSGNLVSRAC
jgi:hypothetical protein